MRLLHTILAKNTLDSVINDSTNRTKNVRANIARPSPPLPSPPLPYSPLLPPPPSMLLHTTMSDDAGWVTRKTKKIGQKLATLKGRRGVCEKCIHFKVLSQYFWPGL